MLPNFDEMSGGLLIRGRGDDENSSPDLPMKLTKFCYNSATPAQESIH